MDKNELLLEYDAFVRSFKRNKDVSHAFLLGAGASISSGIQSAADCTWEWKKDIYTSNNINSVEYFSNYKSDTVKTTIQKWLDAGDEYPKLNSKEEYSFYVEKAYPIEDDRRKYFYHLAENKEPYVGYKLLCLLNQAQILKSVWSTNFDGLIERAAHQMNITPIAVNLDNVDRIYRQESNSELLYVALHGDYKYSSLKNTSKELDNQNDTLEQTLIRHLNDKNLIVIGYSGRDKSLVDSLRKVYSAKGSGRIYWCGYGYDLTPEIESFLLEIRKNGREAYFVPTDGFDKTLIHLCKSCFENNTEMLTKVTEILKSIPVVESIIPFKIDNPRSDRYIKSNLHPISFPKEVFQFEISYNEEEKPWTVIRELTKDKEISAVPFNGKVFAISTLTIINETFSGRIKGEIIRVPISTFDIKNVSTFQTLFLEATLLGISKAKNLNTERKFKLWVQNPRPGVTGISPDINVYEALELSLFFDNRYVYLTFKPTLHLQSEKEISKEVRQAVSKPYLEVLFNGKYDEKLESWYKLIFTQDHLIFDFPVNSASGLKFSITKSTAYSNIKVLDDNFKAYQPKDFNPKLLLHKGIQFMEPQLTFINANSDRPFRDFHPMRGLTNHRPYDFFYNGKVFSSDIKLGVVCPTAYSEKLYSFLCGLNDKFDADKNIDYLLPYPGFYPVYNLPIDIPKYGGDKWLSSNFLHSADSIKTNAINLVRELTAKIESLASNYPTLSIVIFIPEEWQSYRHFEEDGEVFDLHDYIKAFAAQRNIATQLIEESTLTDNLKCQIYWWLSLSFYVKSLRTPWVLSNLDVNTAYAGIGYSVKRRCNETEIVLGCSHIYDSLGQGLKYKLSRVEDFVLDKKSNPYLSYDEAFKFGISIRELFMQSMNTLPQRVVIHKRTPFKETEINGIIDSLSKAGVKKVDLIEINFEHDVRYFATKVNNWILQTDGFPISRGTCVLLNDKTALLWTHGIVPSVRNPKFKYYLGGRSIPSPLKIVKHYGEADLNTIATEILGLTKMNWNSFDLYTKLPATIDSSNTIARIGNLLSRFEGKMYDYRFFI